MLAPPPDVLQSFGVGGEPTRLAGGQETSWRAGDLVLKPHVDARLQEWFAHLPASAGPDGRVTTVEVVRSRDGRWAVDGWGATRFVPDARPLLDRRDWGGILASGRALHRGWAGVERPRFLDHRDDPWQHADRAAWGELHTSVHPDLVEPAERLRAGLEDLGPPTPAERERLVHGDLTGNVLARPDGSVVVIDLSPYWRPPTYAEGVVVADALTWHGAAPDLGDTLGVPVPSVLRALLFRVLASSELARGRSGGAVAAGNVERYRRTVEALRL
ncbi:TIGR02569 family protein [Phycicoccus sp. CSK15P-2]|uniref:TIGR02569 family protein n=1 Tax=Phycicoccus sp. CSK15P-2 TaxID=2807627 RepID=UPI0019519789|nr:TIGR02569 family protein [Phycicoccus sp. CSK15P-2]MBM6405204.1 TIGR02569 family protein [Phycicoccus sp. CSK15P-2]